MTNPKQETHYNEKGRLMADIMLKKGGLEGYDYFSKEFPRVGFNTHYLINNTGIVLLINRPLADSDLFKMIKGTITHETEKRLKANPKLDLMKERYRVPKNIAYIFHIDQEQNYFKPADNQENENSSRKIDLTVPEKLMIWENIDTELGPRKYLPITYIDLLNKNNPEIVSYFFRETKKKDKSHIWDLKREHEGTVEPLFNPRYQTSIETTCEDFLPGKNPLN